MKQLINKSLIKLSIFIFIIFSYKIDAKIFLVFGGKTGWIGKKIIQSIQEQGHSAYAAQSRLENREHIEQEIDSIKPDFIINAAGSIGKINVDWCEDHKEETLRSGLIGALNLADIANQRNIHLTNIGTGCIYNYDEQHPMYSGIGFSETDIPNFQDAFYTKMKIILENYLQIYKNVLNLRFRLPIASDYHQRNLFVKLTRYQKVVNIPNSITVLDDLIPLIPQMSLRGLTGIYNFVNPGVITHNEILELYKKYLDPTFKYENFSIDEQNKILKARRGYNELDVRKLLHEFPTIPHVKDAVENIFKKLKNNLINKCCQK